MFKKGDKVHLGTKDHRTFEGTVMFNDSDAIIIRVVDGSKSQFTEDHTLAWTDIVYCEEQAQWDLQCEIEQDVNKSRDSEEDD